MIDEASRLHIEPKASLGYQEYAWSFLSEVSLLHTEYNQHGDLSGTNFDEKVTLASHKGKKTFFVTTTHVIRRSRRSLMIFWITAEIGLKIISIFCLQFF